MEEKQVDASPGFKSAKHYTRSRPERASLDIPPPSSAFLFYPSSSGLLSCLCEAVTPGCRPSFLVQPLSTVLRSSFASPLPPARCSRLILAGLGMHSSLVFSLPLIPAIVSVPWPRTQTRAPSHSPSPYPPRVDGAPSRRWEEIFPRPTGSHSMMVLFGTKGIDVDQVAVCFAKCLVNGQGERDLFDSR